MKTKLPFLLCFIACQTTHGQLNDLQRGGGFSTGYVESWSEQEARGIREQLSCEQLQQPLRTVTNRVYNLKPLADWIRINNRKSARPYAEWSKISGTVDSKLPGVVLVEVSRDRRVAVTNYSGQAIEGRRFLAFAVQTGHYENGFLYLDLFDCGKPYVPPPPTPEQLESAKAAASAEAKEKKQERQRIAGAALKYNQELADKGDAYGQLRMGERFLTGDGVEKNETKAREYLKRSADQGNETAKAVLEKMSG